MDIESVGKIEQVRRAVGSILNLIRYQPISTLEDAEARLRVLDEFAMEAFLAISEVENAETLRAEHSDRRSRPTIPLGQAFSETPNLGTRH
jgi:hypothetical protein